MSLRLFTAIDLSTEFQDALLDLQRQARLGNTAVRWSPRENLHLTLAFIGEVDHTTFEDIRDALAGVQAPPIVLRLGGLGQFPPRGLAQTLHVQVQRDAALMAVQQGIKQALKRIGAPYDDKPYTPHITLARCKPPLNADAFIGAHLALEWPPLPRTTFTLYRSDLRPSGPVYSAEAVYGLRG